MEIPDELDIIAVQHNEMEILTRLAFITFMESYYSKNEESLFDKYVAEKLNPAQLSEEWQDPNSFFYFAKWKGEICGYLKINFEDAQTETHDSDWMEIERIYILKAYQRKNLGTSLFNFTLTQANNRHINFIWVGVWKENRKAISFYEKLGFEHSGVHLFDFGGELQEDYIMQFRITRHMQ